MGLVLGLAYTTQSSPSYHTDLSLSFNQLAPKENIPYADLYGREWRLRLIAKEMGSTWMLQALASDPEIVQRLKSEWTKPQIETRLLALSLLTWRHFILGEAVYPQLDGSESATDEASEWFVSRLKKCLSVHISNDKTRLIIQIHDRNPELVQAIVHRLPTVYEKVQPIYTDLSPTVVAADASISDPRVERLLALYQHREEMVQILNHTTKILPSSVHSETLENLQDEILISKMSRDQMQRNLGADHPSVIEMNRAIGMNMARFNKELRPQLTHLDAIVVTLEDTLFSEHSEGLLARDISLLQCLTASLDCNGLLQPHLIESTAGPLTLHAAQKSNSNLFLFTVSGTMTAGLSLLAAILVRHFGWTPRRSQTSISAMIPNH
jgi:hypothetical protein